MPKFKCDIWGDFQTLCTMKISQKYTFSRQQSCLPLGLAQGCLFFFIIIPYMCTTVMQDCVSRPKKRHFGLQLQLGEYFHFEGTHRRRRLCIILYNIDNNCSEQVQIYVWHRTRNTAVQTFYGHFLPSNILYLLFYVEKNCTHVKRITCQSLREHLLTNIYSKCITFL